MGCARDNEMVVAGRCAELQIPYFAPSKYQSRSWHKLLPVMNLLLGAFVFTVYRLRFLI